METEDLTQEFRFGVCARAPCCTVGCKPRCTREGVTHPQSLTHTCVFTSSYSHVAQDPCANSSTRRQAFSIHTHTHTHTHLHTPSAPLHAQGGGSWAQCPEARGASPAKRQAGAELGDELRGRGVCLPAQTPFPWRRAGALSTELPQDRRALGACDSRTSHCEWRVCSLLRHSTCDTLFSLMSILQHLGSHPIVSRRKYRLKEVKWLVQTPQQQTEQMGF